MNGGAPDRPYLSIGEVLALLKDEFPDVTISKIRFLESQGLLEPERTPSGYRKFYDGDVERLRWILRQQREHFLPLKVIKGRLVGGPPALPADEPSPAAGSEPSPAGPYQGERRTVIAGPSPLAALAAPGPAAVPEPPAAPPSAVPATPVAPPATRAPARPSAEALMSAGSGASMTLYELCAATGLDTDTIAELEKYGLLDGRKVAGAVHYDEEALLVANLAVAFARFGVQPRHLRLYRTSAEREASFLEQVVSPLLKQRNPESRREALRTLDELTHLGQNLRQAMVHQLLRQFLESPSSQGRPT